MVLLTAMVGVFVFFFAPKKQNSGFLALNLATKVFFQVKGNFASKKFEKNPQKHFPLPSGGTIRYEEPDY